MNKYLLKPALKTIKEGFFLHDENDNMVYEGKMIKFSLLGASPYEFINHKTNKREEHKVGKTINVETGGNDLIGFMSKKSYFKYDGVKIWDYLHELGIRIDTNPSNDKLGMTYTVSYQGNQIATIKTSTPKGKSIITTSMYYDVMCDEKDLDLVFLVAFSIAKTEQIFYN